MKKLLTKIWLEVKALFFTWSAKGFRKLADKFEELDD